MSTVSVRLERESVPSSASKALALLEVIARAQGGLAGVSEVAVALGMPKSTTHRLLKTLEEHGLVGRAGQKYRIGNAFFELSEAARWSQYGELREIANEPLSYLFDRAGGTVHLAVIVGRDVLYLEKITERSGCRLPSRVGARFPATCTALGKAILAFSDRLAVSAVVGAPLHRATRYSIRTPRQLSGQLQAARSAGIAYEFEEARLGAACVAAPVLVGGKAVAAVSICRPTAGRSPVSDNLVRSTADRIAQLLPAY